MSTEFNVKMMTSTNDYTEKIKYIINNSQFFTMPGIFTASAESRYKSALIDSRNATYRKNVMRLVKGITLIKTAGIDNVYQFVF